MSLARRLGDVERPAHVLVEVADLALQILPTDVLPRGQHDTPLRQSLRLQEVAFRLVSRRLDVCDDPAPEKAAHLVLVHVSLRMRGKRDPVGVVA